MSVTYFLISFNAKDTAWVASGREAQYVEFLNANQPTKLFAKFKEYQAFNGESNITDADEQKFYDMLSIINSNYKHKILQYTEEDQYSYKPIVQLCRQRFPIEWVTCSFKTNSQMSLKWTLMKSFSDFEKQIVFVSAVIR